MNSVFIPGSSIKRILRTALAYSVISSNPGIVKGLFNKEGLPNKPQNADEKLMNNIFNCGVKKKNGETDYKDSKYDLLKLLKISDTQYLSHGCIEIYPYDIYSKKNSSGLLPRQKEDLYLEVIRENFNDFTVEVSIDRNFLSAAQKLETSQEWIGLNEKLEKIFGIKLSRAKREDIEGIEKIIIEKIAEATKSFSKAVISYYKKLWEGQSPLFLHKSCNSAVGEDFRNRNKKLCLCILLR